MKTLSVGDFARLGYLQELNRLLLHQLGLDLQVKEVNGKLEFGDIIDFRDNEFNLSYRPDYLDNDKKEYIEQEFNRIKFKKMQQFAETSAQQIEQ
jgi:hypothetical protein